jgi:hypothetical protein
MHQFEAQLKKGINHQGWTYVDIPETLSKKFKKKGRIPVTGFVENESFRTSILPKGDGTYYLFVSQPLQKKTGKTAGDYVKIKLSEDIEPRTVDVPNDIIEAFSVSQKALSTFTRFSYSHKKELTEWINEAKRTETRERRIIKAIVMLENYKKQGK